MLQQKNLSNDIQGFIGTSLQTDGWFKINSYYLSTYPAFPIYASTPYLI